MQVANSEETSVKDEECSEEIKKSEKSEVSETKLSGDRADYDSVLDVSGKNLDFSVPNGSEDSIEGLYVYKNVFNLIPRWLGGFRKLKTLKFFGNEINLFPTEFTNLVELECLQVKISSPSLTGLPLHKLKVLKELELCKVPPRPSAFPLLSEIAGLKSLNKLSVCHFSLRYLPPEIGCLKSLEYLDLSFNKIRSLPTEITYLNALISLKVANNKLAEIPSGLSSLQRLEILDLSNNRLASLECLELGLMHNLQTLNLQYNKLLSCCQIPSWIFCNLEGNGKDTGNDDFISSAVEMDVFEGDFQEIDDSVSRKGYPITSPSHLPGSSSNSRCFAARRSGKGWKRRYYLQQRARQERLNSSRKWKSEDHSELLTQKAAEKCKPCKHAVLSSESHAESASAIRGPDIDNKELHFGETECEITCVEDDNISTKKEYDVDNCSCVTINSVEICKDGESDCKECDASLDAVSDGTRLQGECSSSAVCSSTLNSKRHPDMVLDNPKPSKTRRPTADHSDVSCKYSKASFCSIDDHLPDGFYDAGRDRPFMPLRSYEQNLHLDSREVILLDRKNDEELDATALCAQALVFHFKQINGSTKQREQFAIDNLQIVSLLALFVSDHFGGSDRSATIERTRKAVSGSNYRKPFVCTCSTGNSESVRKPTKQSVDSVDDIVFLDLCEKSLHSVKARQNSIVVPIGTLQFGVCRHRALLMKYLCDRMEPRVPCELVRGYFDFSPHAWNVVVIKRGDALVRMIVDTCRPHDIREETDQEYFCRYVPMSRINIPCMSDSDAGPSSSLPSLSECDELEKAPSSTLVRCDFGSVEAIAKVRTLETDGTSAEAIRNFEYSCLGEVRILRALKKHACIVEVYGHQISSKWVQLLDGKPEHRQMQSAIVMEYIKGGPLKNYLEKLSRTGEKHVRVELALYIARDVACALMELHSKHIIHRDIKSENILIDIDRRRPDGTPIVKLCDFDRAVPLRSCLHSCCIAHTGIPPPNVCVGTPRWMAPEVFRAMHKPNMYGLEVDIWSFGCLLLELLTLQVPYSGLSESDIHDLLQMGKRPPLTGELEAMSLPEEPAMAPSGGGSRRPEAELETLKFLVDIYWKCTKNNPADRPKAENLYDMLIAHASLFTGLRSSEQEG
ncbi:Mitogen-activated protein kinase kinase kinase [Actinidia chinensis var. chinensis]|uniref:Mitogen-activated protein kinase kinase kinase n=1 Tax=Actinidia chinensis var. chinensis TaxID=1590841 RepID=A0A2R6PKB1_ACTCC|nr:Mitogen-activated protein kinase kinase kinase [Actinidia chinensis var. chinensis]